VSTHQISLGSVRVSHAQPAPRPVAGSLAFAQPDRAEPWRRHHVFVSLTVAVVGSLGMIVCWYVGAGKRTYHDQVPWLVGSIASAGIAVAGGVVWLVCGFRQVALLERDLLGCLRPWLASAQGHPAGAAGTQATGSLVIAAGMHRAHRPECLLVRGKPDLTPMAPAEANVRGLPRCGVCGS
jgi:hypothetical protein